MTLRARLERLERRHEAPRRVLVVPLRAHDTKDQAFARHCGDDRPAPNTPVFIRKSLAAPPA